MTEQTWDADDTQLDDTQLEVPDGAEVAEVPVEALAPVGTSATTTEKTEKTEKTDQADQAVLAAARTYVARGWQVVPLHPKTKQPIGQGWQKGGLRADDLERAFAARLRRNVGLLLGKPSGGLVDVDCDAPEAVAAAALLLPRTGRVSGRASKPASHYWYRVPDDDLPARTIKFQWQGSKDTGTAEYAAYHAEDAEGEPEGDEGQDGHEDKVRYRSGADQREGTGDAVSPSLRHSAPNSARTALKSPVTAGGMLVELRADGGQTMVPPSVHPSGERVRWERAGEPGRIGAQALARAVAKVAAAALLARHWPAQGSRDEAALALAGLLVRGGWDVVSADDFSRAVAHVAGDEEWRQRAKAAQTFTTLREGRPTMGGTRLGELLAGGPAAGAEVVAQVRGWLGLRAHMVVEDAFEEAWPQGDGRPLQGDGAVETSPLGHDHPLTVTYGEPGHFLSEYTPVPVRALWGGRLYLGKLAICDGDPGNGKTLLALDLAARITTGREMPDGSPGLGAPAGVVYFTAEDDPADTLAPRLRAAGGDPERLLVVTLVTFLTTEEGQDGARPKTKAITRLPTFRDTAVIARAIQRAGARLVIFDPFMAYLDRETNSWRDQDVRAVLAPLAQVAEQSGAAFLMIRHLSKASGGNALYRGGGSIGIIGAMRSGLLVGRDPDDPDRCLVATTKNNLSKRPATLAYRVLTTPDGLPSLRWEGESRRTAADLAAPSAGVGQGSAASKVEQAKTRLREWLADGPVPVLELERRCAEAGISEWTLKEAKKALGIAALRVSMAEGEALTSYWQWQLPPALATTDLWSAERAERAEPQSGRPRPQAMGAPRARSRRARGSKGMVSPQGDGLSSTSPFGEVGPSPYQSPLGEQRPRGDWSGERGDAARGEGR